MTQTDQTPSERYAAWLAINEAILMRNHFEVERLVFEMRHILDQINILKEAV